MDKILGWFISSCGLWTFILANGGFTFANVAMVTGIALMIVGHAIFTK